MILRDDLRDARTHAGMNLVLFDGNDRAAILGGRNDRGFVHRFDGVIVDNATLDSVLGQFFGSH